MTPTEIQRIERRMVDRCGELLERFTYKPGWQFQVAPMLMSQAIRSNMDEPLVNLYVKYWAHDSDLGMPRPEVDMVIQLGRSITIPRFVWDNVDMEDDRLFARIFYRWMEHILGNMEIHERDEWIRVDGERVHDPHNRRPTVSPLTPVTPT